MCGSPDDTPVEGPSERGRGLGVGVGVGVIEGVGVGVGVVEGVTQGGGCSAGDSTSGTGILMHAKALFGGAGGLFILQTFSTRQIPLSSGLLQAA